MEQLTISEENSLLIVDDDRPFRERLARAMETRGFAVKSAETVRQGVAMVNDAPPAFAFSALGAAQLAAPVAVEEIDDEARDDPRMHAKTIADRLRAVKAQGTSSSARRLTKI